MIVDSCLDPDTGRPVALSPRLPAERAVLGTAGTGVAGGVSAFFGDQLSDQTIATAIQANGTVRDIGGAVYYTNLRNRWNYGAGLRV